MLLMFRSGCMQTGIQGFKAKSELCLIDCGLALFAFCQNQLIQWVLIEQYLQIMFYPVYSLTCPIQRTIHAGQVLRATSIRHQALKKHHPPIRIMSSRMHVAILSMPCCLFPRSLIFAADGREVDLQTHDTNQIASTNSSNITSLTSSISFELWNKMDILPFIHHMSYYFMSFGQLSSIFQVTD